MEEKKFWADKIEIPKEIDVIINNDVITIKGPNGENSRKLFYPGISIYKEDNNIIFKSSKKYTKKNKVIVNTYKAHIKNMINGSLENYTYTLKISQSHFPMNVSVEGNMIVIKNFLGEKIPRKAKIVGNSNVEINGDELIITSNNIESAGQTASNIEIATKVSRKDRRVFGDGIFIIKKPSRKIHK